MASVKTVSQLEGVMCSRIIMKFPCDDTDDDGGISVDMEINKRKKYYLNEFHNRHIFWTQICIIMINLHHQRDTQTKYSPFSLFSLLIFFFLNFLLQ